MSEDLGVSVPDVCDIAFKEWAGVCAALDSGRQSLILRKGGVEEGPDGFVPEHRAFWLYPTSLHQAAQGLKEDANPSLPSGPEGCVAIRDLAMVHVLGRVERIETLQTLDDLHVWTWETIEQRFHYRRPGLWVLGVRIYRRDPAAQLRITPEHAGCKTWVPLEAGIPVADARPVLDNARFRSAMSELRARLGTNDS